LGINEPDQDFLGAFHWDPGQKVWIWQRETGLYAPESDLSAVIRQSACTDPVRKETFSYSTQVTLPQGDTVNGCCRKLKAGEASVGPHGYEPVTPPPK
jgi:uncharacterized membrane protein